MTLSNSTIAANLGAMIADNSDGDDNSAFRKKSLDYYYMRARGDEIPGRSQVISGDLSAMTEAVLSQMLDAFTTDNAIEFEPSSQDDEQQAKLESDVVSYLVMEANNGFITFEEAIKDALLLRNGINKIWVQEDTEVQEADFTNVTPEAFLDITKGDQQTVIDVIEYEGTDLKVKATRTKRNLKVQSVATENFILTAFWDSLDLQDVPFCAEIRFETRSSLREMGFSKKIVDGLVIDSVKTTDDTARNIKNSSSETIVPDRSQEEIKVHECYVLMDVDEDGISERRRILLAGPEVLSNDIVTIVPYAAGAVFIAPHRFLGVSLFDKLKQVQDISTALNRALLDNANASNKSRLAYVKGAVNMDDMEDGRVNGLIECKDSVDQVRALLVPDISQGILSNIEHQKRTRAEMGGASLQLASGQAQLGSTQVGSEGLDRAYSVMEQLAGMMAKNIAETLVKQTFLIAHATLRQNFDIPVNIRVGGRWNTATPSEWDERKRINIKIGMSAGERNRKIAALDKIIGQQGAINSIGLDGVLVDVEGLHNALIDLAKASEIDNPERYFVDPQSKESQAAGVQKQQEAELQETQNQSLVEQALEIEQLKVAMDKYTQDTDLKFKYFEANIKSEVEEAKIVGAATKDLQVAQAEARRNANGAGTEQVGEAREATPEEPAVAETPGGSREPLV